MPLSGMANGNISPSRFVKMDTTAMGKFLQCAAGDKIFGISQPGTNMAPYPGLDTGFAAQASSTGNPSEFQIFVLADRYAMLTLGGTVTQFDRLKSDASGQGVTTTTAGDEIGAIALMGGVSGDIIPVEVISPQQL